MPKWKENPLTIWVVYVWPEMRPVFASVEYQAADDRASAVMAERGCNVILRKEDE